MQRPKRGLLIAGIMFLIIGCGGPQEKGPTSKPRAKFDPYARLTETEVKQFIRAYPIFVEEAKKHGKALEKWQGTKSILGVTGAYTEYISRYKEMEATLRARTGMGVEQFFTAYYKIMWAYAALSVQKGLPPYDEVIANIENQLKKPGLSKQTRDMLNKQLQMAKQTRTNVDTIYKKVPAENIALVQKYENELKAVIK